MYLKIHTYRIRHVSKIRNFLGFHKLTSITFLLIKLAIRWFQMYPRLFVVVICLILCINIECFQSSRGIHAKNPVRLEKTSLNWALHEKAEAGISTKYHFISFLFYLLTHYHSFMYSLTWWLTNYQYRWLSCCDGSYWKRSKDV